MKTSKYISRIARTNIVKKGQRTWLSLVSILLSTAIIFTSLTLFINIFTFSKNVNYDEIGNYHFAAYIDQEVMPSTRYDMTLDINTKLYGSYQGQSFNWRELQVENESNLLPFQIVAGKLPAKQNEILVSDDMKLNVGDTVELTK